MFVYSALVEIYTNMGVEVLQYNVVRHTPDRFKEDWKPQKQTFQKQPLEVGLI